MLWLLFVAALHVVDGLSGPGSKVGFPECLTASGVSVADAGNVFAGGAVFKSKSSFVNHLSSSWSNNVRPQKSVSGLLPKDLDQTVSVIVALGSAVGGKGELSNIVGNSVGLQLLLILANPGHLGVGVDHARHAVVVDVNRTPNHSFAADNCLVLGLVREHGALDDVADGVDVGVDGLEAGVDGYPASVVPLDTNILQSQVVCVGTTANTDQQNIGIHLFSFSVLDTFDGHLDLSSLLPCSHHLRVQLELDPLLGHDALELLGDVHVNSHPANVTKELNGCNLGSKSGPNGSELNSNDTGTNQNHLLRHLLQAESSSGGHNGILINLNAREWGDFAAGGNHDVLRVHNLCHAAVWANNGHLVGSCDLAMALQVGHLVALEQHLDPACQSGHGL